MGRNREDVFRRRFSGGRIQEDVSGRRPSRDAYREMCLGDVSGRRLLGRYIPGHGRVYLSWLCFMNFLYLFIKKSIDKAYYMSYSIFKPILYDI